MTSITNSRILVVVPCKLGSKRLPGKNFCLVGGVSLVQRACLVALKALPGANVVVVFQGGIHEETVDWITGPEVNGRVDYMVTQSWFPQENASLLAMYALTHAARGPEAVVLLQPSTLRRAELVLDAVDSLDMGYESAVSVSHVKHCVGNPEAIQYNGGVYAWRTGALLGKCFRPLEGAATLIDDSVIDIDTIGDLAKAATEWED